MDMVIIQVVNNNFPLAYSINFVKKSVSYINPEAPKKRMSCALTGSFFFMVRNITELYAISLSDIPYSFSWTLLIPFISDTVPSEFMY